MHKINLLQGFSGGARIYLTKGACSLVDEEDFEELNSFQWRALWDSGTQSFYAVRNICRIKGKRRLESMHRHILGLQPGDKHEVDHIDHNTLNNRRYNLRIVSRLGNTHNRRDQSKYGIGVCFPKDKKRSKPYQARIWINGKRKSLGRYFTPEDAQNAYILYVKEQERKLK